MVWGDHPLPTSCPDPPRLPSKWTGDHTLFHPPGLGLHSPTLWPRKPAKEESPDLLLLAMSRLGISVNPRLGPTNKTYTQTHPSINAFRPLILFVAISKGALIPRARRTLPPIYLAPIDILPPHSIPPDKGEIEAGGTSPDL